MDSLQNLPFYDHPSNGESFETASVSNQSLIDLLNGKLAGGVDKIELSADQVREIIQGLQEPKKFPPTDEPESSATKELRVLKHHCRLGDYAGRFFNYLKLHNTDAPLPKLATELVELWGEVDSDRPMAQAIEEITYRIRNQGGDIDSAMAKFAVQAYAARNQVCYGEAGHLVIAEKWDDLAQRFLWISRRCPKYSPKTRCSSWKPGVGYCATIETGTSSRTRMESRRSERRNPSFNFLALSPLSAINRS